MVRTKGIIKSSNVRADNRIEIVRSKASEGTTNPSLLYQAAKRPEYLHLINYTLEYTRQLDDSLSTAEKLDRAVEHLSVQFGTEIYKITGGISTEVDVTHSFNVSETVAAALRIIELYKQNEVPKAVVRIKISATWEGIQAARILENEHGVSVLITVVFGLQQAIAAAEVGVTCIAPYVGRIGDWYKANGGADAKSNDDMGLERVKEMQNYIRKYGYQTKVMAASFRTVEQVIGLAGTDYLTISPIILDELKQRTGTVKAKLTAESGEHHKKICVLRILIDNSQLKH